MRKTEQRELLTEREAATRLGLKNHNTLAVWRCTKRYSLRYIRIGRHIRYDALELERFLKRQTVSDEGAA
jgi:hypothetical protein